MRSTWAEWRPILAPSLPHRAPITKLCVHTTEGYSASGAWNTLSQRGVPSHYILDPVTDTAWQCVDTMEAAHSLWHVDQSGVIQIEVVGFAARTPLYDDQWYARLGWWMDQICYEHSIPVVFAQLWPQTAEQGYGRHSPFRFSFSEWDEFEGIVGHCHAPSRWWTPKTNTHWDPGGLDINRLGTYMINPTEGAHMNLVIDTEGAHNGEHWIVGMPNAVNVTNSGARAQHVADFDAANATLRLRYAGDIVRKGYDL